MKRLYFIFVMLLAAWAAQATQVTRTYTLNFNQGDFTYTIDDHLLYISSSSHVISFDTDTLLPAMPYIGVSILVRPYEDYSSFNIQKTETLIQNNVLMGPNPKVVPVSMMPEVLETTPTPNYRGWNFPTTDISYTGSYTTDGYKVICFRLCPFRYNAIAKKLYLATSVTLSVTLDSHITPIGHGIPIYPVVTGGSNMRQTVTNMVINGNELPMMYNTPLNVSNSFNNYEYIIVTSQTLRPIYERLAIWKNRKGVRTKVITVEDIYASDLSDDPNPIKIKRALSSYYNKNESPTLTYALMGGGVDIVPTLMCNIRVDNLTQPDTALAPTDLYYSSLKQLDWDTDGNGKYGEFEDNVDIAPDIAVSRIPLSDVNELEPFIERLIAYECNPDTVNWKNDILMCGRVLEKYHIVPPDSVLASDAQMQSKIIFDNDIEPYWNGTMTRFFDTINDINWTGGFTADKLQEELSKGYTFVQVDTHGSVGTWQTDSGFYIPAHALNLHNSGNTIITTSACHTNAFDSYYCLSADFFHNTQSGILGYVGCSNQSWGSYNPMCLGDTQERIGAFYSYLLDTSNMEKQSFGKSFMYSKMSDMVGVNMSTSTTRWMLCTFNALGDPEMPVFIKKPKVFQNVILYNDNNNERLYIESGLDGSRYCMMKDDETEPYYETQSYYSGVYFPYRNGMCHLSITHSGYIPYLIHYGDIVYLQNEVLEGSNHIIATDRTIISSNACSNNNIGPIRVKNGKTTINSTNGVTINDSFSVDLGAEFDIR